MKSGGVILLVGTVLVILLARVIWKARNGKEKKTREYYAFKCVALLFALATDVIAALAAPMSFWDILAGLLHLDHQTSDYLTLLTKVLIVIVFVLCWWFVSNTYRYWVGPVSRRQYKHDVEDMDDAAGILRDALLVISGIGKKNLDLKEYRPYPDMEEQPENDFTRELVWHIEFARMYRLMSNQAHIDEKNDWHQQEHCFISSYMDNHKIAIYCTDSIPTEQQIKDFLDYIFNFNEEYFRIIVAVRDGEERNYKECTDGQEIEYIFKKNALDQLVDFSDYYRAIKMLYNNPLMGSTQFKIEDVYVEPDCALKGEKKRHKLNDYIWKWLGEDENRQLALLGDFGQGKTLYSIYLTYQMIQQKAERIPILIPLRNKSPRNSSQAEILSYFAVQYGINVEALMILNANGRLLLIFDGFDEMDLVGNDDIRKRHFRSLWSLTACGRSKILITGRPNYFVSPEEMSAALEIQKDTKELPYCQELWLQPFDEGQILSALRNAKKSVRDGIEYVLKNRISKSFLDLISRPSHLFLVSLIWDERELEKKYKNLSSAIIINEFLQNSFERQAAKSGADSYSYLSPVEREYFMIGIAVKMYKMGMVAISYEVFHETVWELLELFPDKLSQENSVYMNIRNGKSVKEFASQDKNSAWAIINDVRTCGILVNDYVNNGMAFAHKSFFDLLVAKYYMGKHFRHHDQYMVIADALSQANTYNLKNIKEIVTRKLLAELLAAHINMTVGNDMDACKRIFSQCQKTIMNFPIRYSPRALLRMCLEKEGKSVLASGYRNRSKSETRRFLFLMIPIPMLILIYLVRSAYLVVHYGERAAVYFSNMESQRRFYEVGNVPEMNQLLIAGIMTGVILVMLFSIVRGIVTEYMRSRADLVLLTWYYACQENEIPNQLIKSNFSEKEWRFFRIFIEGRDLNEL